METCQTIASMTNILKTNDDDLNLAKIYVFTQQQCFKINNYLGYIN